MLEKKPKIESGQPQESGKLTLEEIKEMVNKYKKEHEGLLPEFFSLPGEEVEVEEERQCSEETILAYEIKEFLEKIRPEIENKTLIENAEDMLKFYIEFGRVSIKDGNAFWAIYEYTPLKQSDLWPKFDQEFRDWVEKNIQNPQLIENAAKYFKDVMIDYSLEASGDNNVWAICGYNFFKQSGLWSKFHQKFKDGIEKNIKDPKLIKNLEEELEGIIESLQNPIFSTYGFISQNAFTIVLIYTSLKQSGLWSNLDQKIRNSLEENIQNRRLIKSAEEHLKPKIKIGQKPSEDVFASSAVFIYAIFFQFQKILEEEGRRKEIAKESQKAMHPEKKLPPIPEEKAF